MTPSQRDDARWFRQHPDEAKAIITYILVGFVENDLDNLVPYLKHVGFGVDAIQDTKELLPGHS